MSIQVDVTLAVLCQSQCDPESALGPEGTEQWLT
jgi:hypothetical protein